MFTIHRDCIINIHNFIVHKPEYIKSKISHPYEDLNYKYLVYSDLFKCYINEGNIIIDNKIGNNSILKYKYMEYNISLKYCCINIREDEGKVGGRTLIINKEDYKYDFINGHYTKIIGNFIVINYTKLYDMDNDGLEINMNFVNLNNEKKVEFKFIEDICKYNNHIYILIMYRQDNTYIPKLYVVDENNHGIYCRSFNQLKISSIDIYSDGYIDAFIINPDLIIYNIDRKYYTNLDNDKLKYIDFYRLSLDSVFGYRYDGDNRDKGDILRNDLDNPIITFNKYKIDSYNNLIIVLDTKYDNFINVYSCYGELITVIQINLYSFGYLHEIILLDPDKETLNKYRNYIRYLPFNDNLLNIILNYT